MMLSKEVKDILEGSHFFLSDGLRGETLSGKAECMRRGLLLQLERLRSTNYPMLEFCSTLESNANLRHTSTSLPYLNEQQNGLVNGSRMSTGSSASATYSSSNGSSTGYSGDGVVMAHNRAMLDEKKQDNYEDFDDFENEGFVAKSCATANASSQSAPFESSSVCASQRRDSESPLPENDDFEPYADNIDIVPFRVIVGRCDHHGVLSKRIKGPLPGLHHSRSFRCVLAGHLLYLFLKEGDDKQKKTINLDGYELRTDVSDADFKTIAPRRRPEFAFELVARGRKTHVFSSSKRASLDRWVVALRRVMPSPSANLSAAKNEQRQQRLLDKVEESFSPDEDDDDEDENEDDEFYEELNPDMEMCDATHAQWRPPAVTPDRKVNPAAEVAPTPPVVKTSNSRRKLHLPPIRPPLPRFLRQKLLSHLPRPLPDAPSTNHEDKILQQRPHDDQIYSEIDEEDNTESKLVSNHDELKITASSLSKEIFDTIRKRVPSLPSRSSPPDRRWTGDPTAGRRPPAPLPMDNYDVPNVPREVRDVPQWRLESTSPSLPIKSSSTDSIQESEYKVPSATPYVPSFSEDFYNVPNSNPVPVRSLITITNNKDEIIQDHSEVDSGVVDLSYCSHHTSNSEDKCNATEYDNLQSNNENENKANCVDKSESTINESNTSLSKDCTENNEHRKISSTTSVKELIAKLNQTGEVIDVSQTLIGANNSFRKSKHIIVSDAINDETQTAEKEVKNQIEVSRSVQSIKNDLENNDIFKMQIKQIKEHGEITKSISDPYFSNGNHLIDTNILYENCRNEKIEASDFPATFIAKFAYMCETNDQLSFNRGDEIIVRAMADDRFWRGTVRGREGLVPKDYLRKNL